MDTLGLYLHIPFCHSKCAYCDFCSFPATEGDLRHRYATALVREIEARAPRVAPRRVESIFFGGGTPTLLAPEDFRMLTGALREHFAVAADAEFTVECNPRTADASLFRLLREVGVNRLSIGMQSANDDELALLGRAHRHEDLLRAVSDAREAGFENINLDLMFGIPAQTEKSFSRTLEAAIRLCPTHLSVYSLQLEEGTPFYERRHSLPLPSEEEERQMAALLSARLAAAGYARYEISNYAKEGYECRHNLRYWEMGDYLGLGIAAHSLIFDLRFYNREDMDAYLADPCSVYELEERLSQAERESEYVMLGLRLCRGIDDGRFSSLFGYGFFEKYGERLAPYFAAGLALYDGAVTRLSDDGLALSNRILSDILD